LYSEWRAIAAGQVQRLSVASQFVTMVMGVFAPWSSGEAGDYYAAHEHSLKGYTPAKQ
jgi:hypothetical protein